MTYRSPLGVELSDRFVRLQPDRPEVRLVTVSPRRFDWLVPLLVIALASALGLAFGLAQKGAFTLPHF